MPLFFVFQQKGYETPAALSAQNFIDLELLTIFLTKNVVVFYHKLKIMAYHIVYKEFIS